jgi:hypothetical protein
LDGDVRISSLNVYLVTAGSGHRAPRCHGVYCVCILCVWCVI